MPEELKHSTTDDSAAQIPVAKMPLIPDYREIRPLGRGGFGTVYLVTDVTGTPFALKVVTRSDEAGDNYRYEREYGSICTHRPISGRHPNLLQILHIGTGDGFFYYTMPLADDLSVGPFDAGAYRQKTFDQVIRSGGRAMLIRDAVQAVLPILDALEFLHEQGTIHRDVKPENILFMNGKPVLGDIGLLAEPKPDMTRMCSKGYSPPGGVTDISGDLFSVGRVLFTAIGGDVSQQGIPVPTVQGGEPSDLFPVLNKVICKAQSLKYKSAEAMKKDLEKILRKGSRHGQSPKVSHKQAEKPTTPQEPATTKSSLATLLLEFRALRHSREYLLARVAPAWSLQRKPDAFSWKNCGGHLYKMTAAHVFVAGQESLNNRELAKIRVAIFLPPKYGPTTPLVYAFANTWDDYSSNADMLPTILSCGYGMVALDTPLTGICKVGADIIEGKNINIDGDFEDAFRHVTSYCRVKKNGISFSYEARRFTARNLFLTEDFLRTKFGITPRKTVITGTRSGILTAGFAFNSSGFGDALLGFDSVPEDSLFSNYFAAPRGKTSSLRELAIIFSKEKRSLKFSADPATYAAAVKPPREVHILMGNQAICAQMEVERALARYEQLEGTSYHHVPLNENNQAAWPRELARMLKNGKSAVWFEGGRDLSGWRSDLWLKFLETKLRMLNGGN